MNKYNTKKIHDFILGIPQDIIQKNNELQILESKKQHDQFTNYFKKHNCYLCKHSLNSYNENVPCLHWLLLPDNMKKRNLLNFLNSGIDFFSVQTYLKWIANTEFFMRNINDLKEKAPNNVFLLETIKYKNIEWTLSIGKTDLEGHQNSEYGKSPHYHIQILKNNKSIIKFNDCHIPLSDDDLFTIACMQEASDITLNKTPFTDSITDIKAMCDQGYSNDMDAILRTVDDKTEAIINRQTLIEASPNNPISGELIYEAIQENKKTKEPIGRILTRKLQSNNVKIATTLSPSENIPELKKRTQRKNNKKN